MRNNYHVIMSADDLLIDNFTRLRLKCPWSTKLSMIGHMPLLSKIHGCVHLSLIGLPLVLKLNCQVDIGEILQLSILLHWSDQNRKFNLYLRITSSPWIFHLHGFYIRTLLIHFDIGFDKYERCSLDKLPYMKHWQI